MTPLLFPPGASASGGVLTDVEPGTGAAPGEGGDDLAGFDVALLDVLARAAADDVGEEAIVDLAWVAVATPRPEDHRTALWPAATGVGSFLAGDALIAGEASEGGGSEDIDAAGDLAELPTPVRAPEDPLAPAVASDELKTGGDGVGPKDGSGGEWRGSATPPLVQDVVHGNTSTVPAGEMPGTAEAPLHLSRGSHAETSAEDIALLRAASADAGTAHIGAVAPTPDDEGVAPLAVRSQDSGSAPRAPERTAPPPPTLKGTHGETPIDTLASLRRAMGRDLAAEFARLASGAAAGRQAGGDGETSTFPRDTAQRAGLVDPPLQWQLSTPQRGESDQSQQHGHPATGQDFSWLRRASALEAGLAPPSEFRLVAPAVAPLLPVQAQPQPQLSAGMVAGPPDAPVSTGIPGASENLSRLVQSLQVQARDGISHATVRLNPGHLGEVTIAIRVDAGSVTAVVRAEVGDVRQWLRGQEESLRAGLLAQGLTLDELVVEQDGRRRDQPFQDADEQARRPRPRGRRDDDARFEVTA